MPLQDLENTTGSWDMYGQDSDKRYPALQAEFFERAGDIIRRRQALRGFVAISELPLHFAAAVPVAVTEAVADGVDSTEQ